MSKNFKDLAHLISANTILKLLGIVTIIVFTRLLSKEELALVPVFALLGRLSVVIFSLGILPTLVRDVPSLIKEKKMEEVYSIIFTSLVIILPGILVFSIVCYFNAISLSQYIFQNDAYVKHFEVMSVGFFFTGISQTFSQIYWSLSRFQQESSRMVIVGILRVITGVVFVIYWGVYGLIFSLVLSSILNFLIYIYNLRKIIFASSRLISIKKLLKESMPFYLESYLMYFRAEGDELVVATFLGAETLAVYYIAKKPFEIFSSLTYSLDRILTTSLARHKNKIEVFNIKLNNLIMLNMFTLSPLLFFTIGVSPTLIILIAGPEYSEAIIPAMILLFTLLIQFSWRSTFGRSIFILKASGSRFIITLIESVLLLGFIYLLGNYFGIFGIVSGRLIATSITGIFAFVFIKNDVRMHINFKNMISILSISIIMCSALLIVQNLISSYLILGLFAFTIVVLFFFIINRTISKQFYDVLNLISPFKISDPFYFLLRK